jgi:hypothetical protein
MPLTDLSRSQGLPFLSQLPKERAVLDYILQQIGKSSSPERYELISAIFQLHLTSAGFDPMALSKARFKRVKASEFRMALREIDAEIAQIIQTEEYKQVMNRQTYLPDLFQKYLLYSASLRQSNHINTRHFKEFSNLLKDKDAGDLLLGFIREHMHLFEANMAEEELTDLLQQYELLMQDQQRNNQLVHAVFELRLSEMLSQRAVRNTIQINALWNLFSEKLKSSTTEYTHPELAEKVMRAGSLTGWPSRNLRPFLSSFAELNINYYYSPYEKHFLLLSCLAAYYVDAGYYPRLQWLDEAEESGKRSNNGQHRASLRLIRAYLAADQGQYDEAVRFLDEAEYHVYRIQQRDFELKNTWIEIARTRVLLNAMAVMQNRTPMHMASFEAQQYLMSGIGKHRTDIPQLNAELNGLTLFLQKSWDEAYVAFQKAMHLRKEEGADHPMVLVNSFYCVLLQPSLASATPEEILEDLTNAKETFYSFTIAGLLNESLTYFRFNSSATR